MRGLGLLVTDLSALGLGADATTDARVSASMSRRCAALGIPLCALVLSVPPSPELDDRISRVADVFAADGVRLALEFVPYTAVRTLAEARAVCERIGYDQLLLATGSAPRRLPFGADTHVLRTVHDSDALREALTPGARLVVIGAGWIGCEVAATARGRGADVVLLEMADAPLERVLGRELGDFFARLHRGHGVELLTGARIDGIEPGPRVVLADGAPVECDAVLLGGDDTEAAMHEALLTRCLSIAGGTTQVLRNLTAERILRLPRG